jgi:hypothetical protein
MLKVVRGVCGLVLAIGLAQATNTQAADGESKAAPPLFADFRAFCLETGAQLAAVARVARQQGATPHVIDPSGRFQSWDHVREGHEIQVSSGVLGNPSQIVTTHCSAKDSNDNNRSPSALEDWLVVPQSERLPQDATIGSVLYNVSFHKEKPFVVESDTEAHKLGLSHKLFVVSVFVDGKYTTLDIFKY